MASKILWSEQSLSNLENILNNLDSNWTEREVAKFKGQLNRNLEIIPQYPMIFPESKAKPGLRKAVLNKQVSIIYQELDDAVRIAYLIDNWQEFTIYYNCVGRLTSGYIKSGLSRLLH